MSMMGGRVPQGRAEVGDTVAAFATYEAAQKAVSALIAGDVPAREIAIVGKGLRSIERVTGRLGYAAAARSGAINGVLLGLFFSAILVIGTPSVPIQAFVGVLFVGIALGMILSLITYSLVRRRRDFASVMQVTADSYEVTVSAVAIHRARQILGGPGGPLLAPPAPAAARPAAAPPRPADTPSDAPRYGERVPPAPDRPAAHAPDAPETAAPDAAAPEAAAPEAAAPDAAAPEAAAPDAAEPDGAEHSPAEPDDRVESR